MSNDLNWGECRASKQEALHSCWEDHEQLARQITAAFALPAPLLGVIGQTFHPIEAPSPDQDTPETKPVCAPLADLLGSQDTWATNEYFYVYKTLLDTYHVFVMHSRIYVASDIEEDLHRFLQARYQQNLDNDFHRYIQSDFAEMYDVKSVTWHNTEDPFKHDSY